MKRLILFYCMFFVSAVTFGQTVTKRRTVETDTLRSFTPDSALFVADTLKVTKLKLPTGTNGYVLTSDANGYLSLSASTGGISSLGGLTGATQTIALDSTYATWNINSSGTVHTFRFPGSRLGFLDKTQTWTLSNTFTGNTYFQDTTEFYNITPRIVNSADGDTTWFDNESIVYSFGGTQWTYAFPTQSGTIAMIGDILQGGKIADTSRIAFLDKTQSFTGAKTFTAATTFSNDVAFGDTIAPLYIHRDKSGGLGAGVRVFGSIGDPPSYILSQDGVNTGLRSEYLYYGANAYFFPYAPDGDSIALQGWVADSLDAVRDDMMWSASLGSAAYMDSTTIAKITSFPTFSTSTSGAQYLTVDKSHATGSFGYRWVNAIDQVALLYMAPTQESLTFNVDSLLTTGTEYIGLAGPVTITGNLSPNDNTFNIGSAATPWDTTWVSTLIPTNDIDTTYLNITQLDGIFLKDSDTTSVVAMQWELDNHPQPVSRVTGLADSLDALRDSIDALRGDIGSGSGTLSEPLDLTDTLKMNGSVLFDPSLNAYFSVDSTIIAADVWPKMLSDGAQDSLNARVAKADTASLKATTSATGFLSDSDWDTFNAKIGTIKQRGTASDSVAVKSDFPRVQWSVTIDSSYINTTDTIIVSAPDYITVLDSIGVRGLSTTGAAFDIDIKTINASTIPTWTAIKTAASTITSQTAKTWFLPADNATVPANAVIGILFSETTTKPKMITVHFVGKRTANGTTY